MARLKLIEMDIDNKMIYFRKDDKLIAFDADAAIELISDSLDGKYEPVRHGHWITQFDDLFPMESTIECSFCGEKEWMMTIINHNYCPNCGAKMDEVKEEPEINPCRGCEDYDGKGGCLSHGGCGEGRKYETD